MLDLLADLLTALGLTALIVGVPTGISMIGSKARKRQRVIGILFGAPTFFGATLILTLNLAPNLGFNLVTCWIIWGAFTVCGFFQAAPVSHNFDYDSDTLPKTPIGSDSVIGLIHILGTALVAATMFV